MTKYQLIFEIADWMPRPEAFSLMARLRDAALRVPSDEPIHASAKINGIVLSFKHRSAEELEAAYTNRRPTVSEEDIEAAYQAYSAAALKRQGQRNAVKAAIEEYATRQQASP